VPVHRHDVETGVHAGGHHLEVLSPVAGEERDGLAGLHPGGTERVDQAVGALVEGAPRGRPGLVDECRVVGTPRGVVREQPGHLRVLSCPVGGMQRVR
jgi:hypothetical protein